MSASFRKRMGITPLSFQNWKATDRLRIGQHCVTTRISSDMLLTMTFWIALFHLRRRKVWRFVCSFDTATLPPSKNELSLHLQTRPSDYREPDMRLLHFPVCQSCPEGYLPQLSLEKFQRRRHRVTLKRSTTNCITRDIPPS